MLHCTWYNIALNKVLLKEWVSKQIKSPFKFQNPTKFFQLKCRASQQIYISRNENSFLYIFKEILREKLKYCNKEEDIVPNIVLHWLPTIKIEFQLLYLCYIYWLFHRCLPHYAVGNFWCFDYFQGELSFLGKTCLTGVSIHMIFKFAPGRGKIHFQNIEKNLNLLPACG